jgi:hypothetical protein
MQVEGWAEMYRQQGKSWRKRGMQGESVISWTATAINFSLIYCIYTGASSH